MSLREAVKGLLRTAEGTFTDTWSLLPQAGPCVDGHLWLQFEGGSGCARCEAWSSNPRTEHVVEPTPASQMNLSDAVAQIRASLAAEPVLPPTTTVPLLPSPVPQLPGMTGPITEVVRGTDRQVAIVDLLLPVVRDGVSLSTLLVTAARIEALL